MTHRIKHNCTKEMLIKTNRLNNCQTEYDFEKVKEMFEKERMKNLEDNGWKHENPRGSDTVHFCPACGSFLMSKYDGTRLIFRCNNCKVYYFESEVIIGKVEPPTKCKACCGPYPNCFDTCHNCNKQATSQ